MKNRRTQIIAFIVAIIPVFVAITPHRAEAQAAGIVGTVIGGVLNSTLFSLTAVISQLEMGIMGALVTITGALLNATMTATLNIKAIVDNTPAIGLTWTTIRNFANIFIIFMLLQAAIKIILGMGSETGKLITNIVIAGLLINFSLFFTKLAVDASNIVSLSFYSAIAPTGGTFGSAPVNGATVASSNTVAGGIVGLVSHAFNDGGLSNVFMQSLDLQSIASASSSKAVISGSNINWNITLANSGASVLMGFAAISFLAAAIAFAVRLGVLIILMVFSPIYFIGMIFPDLQKYSKKWSGMLYAMCIFMPVYLFLMYVAMSIINDPHFFDFASATGAGSSSSSLIGPGLIGLVLQYIIAIFMINAPLIAAITVASEGASFVGDLLKKTSKWGQGVVQGGRGFAGQHTIGRAAGALADKEGFKKFVKSNPFLGTYASQGLKGIAGTSFGGTKGGYEKRFEKYSKAHQDVAKSLELDDSEISSEALAHETRRQTAILEDKLALARRSYRAAVDIDPSSSVQEHEEALRTMAQEEKNINEFEKKLEDKTKITEGAKTELKSQYQKGYAKNLERGGLGMTKKAREDAAEKILKGLTKGKKDKAIDAIKALIPDEDADKK